MPRFLLALLVLAPFALHASAQEAGQDPRLAEALAAQEARRQQMAEMDAQFRAENEPHEDRAAASANAPFPPAVVYQELLPQLRVNERTGEFGLGFFVLAFPDGDRAKMIIRDDRGKEVWSIGYRGQRDGNRTTLRFRKDSRGNRFGIGRRRATDSPVFEASGEYVFEIENGGEVVSRLPFGIRRIESSDPYADAPPRYVMTGIWQSHMAVSYEEPASAGGHQPFLQIHYFDQLMDPDKMTIRFDEERIEIRRDGRLIGRQRRESGNMVHTRSLVTQTIESSQRENAGYRESNVHRGDMTDGAYEVRRVVKADALNNGDFTQTITFEIRDGTFVPVGDQVREGTEPAAFIEGLNRYFYYPITTTR